MIWLDHDKAGMQTLFNNLPKHNSDHSPLSRHATVYTVDVEDGGGEAEVVSALQVFKTTLDGGATELFAVGRFLDTVKLDGGSAQAREAHRPPRHAAARLRLPHSVLNGDSVRIQLNARNRAYQFEAEPGERILYRRTGARDRPALRMRQRHLRHLQGAARRRPRSTTAGRRRRAAST